MSLILASASPRRRELLPQLVEDFIVQPADLDEREVEASLPASSTPSERVIAIARTKAQAVAVSFPDHWVLGVDTAVFLDSEMLGKPKDMEENVQFLQRLSGCKHEVISGLALVGQGHAFVTSCHTGVFFHLLKQHQIKAYVATGDGLDKAGGYGFQTPTAKKFIDRIEGSESNVIGLPMTTVRVLLWSCGIIPLQPLPGQRIFD